MSWHRPSRRTPELREEIPARPSVQDRASSWGRDLLRILGISVLAMLLASLLLWLAGLGLLETDNGTPIVANATWAGILACLLPMMLGFLIHDSDRADDGYRERGLVPLMLVGVLCAVAVQTVVMMLWPLLLGDRAVPGTVAAELGSNGIAVVAVALLALTATTWFVATVLIMFWWAPVGALVVILPFLAEIFLFMSLGIRLFDSPPPGPGALVIWLAFAVAGLGVLALVCALRTRSSHDWAH